MLDGERTTRFAAEGENFLEVCPLCHEIAAEQGWIKEGSPTTPTFADEPRRKRFSLASFLDPRRAVPEDTIAPEPILRRLSGVNSEVVVTVAWDISWYQYRVLPDSAQPVRLAGRGLEVHELEPSFRMWNARVEADGRVVPEIAKL